MNEMILTKFICIKKIRVNQKYEYLIKKCKDVGIKHVNNSNAFIECSNTMDDLYENIYDYNPNRTRKILIVLDDMICSEEQKISGHN